MSNPQKTLAKYLIDIALAVITKEDGTAYALETATKATAKVLTEETKGTKLVVDNKLLAQKKDKEVITGAEITLEDNAFIPVVVKILQGGEVRLDIDGNIIGYSAPLAGEVNTLDKFSLDIYVCNYDASGDIIGYTQLALPNCTGKPIELGFENDKFFAPSYTINSAPSEGQAPYEVEFIRELPIVEAASSVATVLFQTAKSVQSGATVTLSAAPKNGETVWFAPASTAMANLKESAAMTKLAGDGTTKTIIAPTTAGKYKLYVVADGEIKNVSAAELTVTAA